MNKRHTIVLLQLGGNRSRTYYDYESVTQAVEGICMIYEAKLKRDNPNSPKISYKGSELLRWVDDLADVSCLVYNHQIQGYVPHDKQWIKSRIVEVLTKQKQSG